MKAFLSAFFIFLFTVYGAAAQGFPSLKADPMAAEYGRRSASGLSWEDLALISLWASGMSGSAASYLGVLSNAVTELSGALPGGKREGGEYVLEFMHKKFLKTYSEKQTRLDTLLSNGSYNCVSSAVLYAILSSAAGLEVRGVVTRDHAFVKLISGDDEIDVETTNPYGFDPGNRRDFHDNFGRLTGFAYVPAKNYRDRADLNTLELAALIFNNRITELETRGRFDEALSLALDRETLLSFNSGRVYPELFIEPRKMVTDRIFNYGALLIRQGKENEALQWVDMASPLFPDAKRWDEFTDTALNNLLVKLLQAGRFSEARNTLDKNAERSGPLVSARLASMRQTLEETELARLVSSIKNEKDADAALDTLRRGRPELAPEKLKELLVFVVLKKGEFTAKELGWNAAIAFISAARGEYGPDPRLDEQLRVLRTNRIAELHNNFAAAYNRRDFENAKNIIGAALEEFPGNRRFIEDMELAERALR